jgi:acetyl esterase/lipase
MCMAVSSAPRFIDGIAKLRAGGYYFGSLNTHRYSIWRMAKKMNGRAFAVNYRLSPQYPFPCALQDCLAAYLYLIRPPTGAPCVFLRLRKVSENEYRHKAIDPSRIVFAGDSAGAALCLSLLCLIRDEELPLPAGGECHKARSKCLLTR